MFLMKRDRIRDIILGTTMTLIGIVPIGLIATGRGWLMVEGMGLQNISRNFSIVLIAAFTFCGLVLAVAGFKVVRYGRSESDTTSLY